MSDKELGARLQAAVEQFTTQLRGIVADAAQEVADVLREDKETPAPKAKPTKRATSKKK